MEHRISVGELARFWQRGDINFRFTHRSSAIEGIRGHQSVQKKRGGDYVSEKPVSIELSRSGFEIRIQGRVDGFVATANPPLVEEIKTLRVSVEELPASVREMHLAQLKIYAHLLGSSENTQRLLLRLCYLNLDDNSESWIEEAATREALAAFFETTLSRYVHWLTRRQQWLATRNESILQSAFPYKNYRPGQRDMAVAAYRSMTQGQQIVMQAPTGIGKTMAAIFPAVKALSEPGFDKLFYLSAKTSGQQMAEKTVTELQAAGLRIRSVTLTAKDKICFNPGSPCDPDHCEYARGYYDRLGDAMEEALRENDQLTRQVIEQTAMHHTLCPFEFSLDISRAADLVIGDYNYVFDPTVYLRRFFEDDAGKYVLLLDEAHNLVDRGRDMFSAELLKSNFLALRRKLQQDSPPVAKKLAKINVEILAIRKNCKADLEDQGYAVVESVSSKLIKALKGFCGYAEDLLKINTTPGYKDDLLSLYFDCQRFLRTNEQMDEDYAFLLVKSGKDLKMKLFCINPASRLQAGFHRMASSVCFSATMKPREYFRKQLGLNEETSWYQLASPFDPANLGVFVASYIGTSYRERDSSLNDLVELIHRVTASHAGNYLVFFPSHAYLQEAYDTYRSVWPEGQTILQKRHMTEQDRQEFLDYFKQDSEITAFAVMGGIFGEGIDLKGRRLIGVIVTGVGLPQPGVERELIRNYWKDSGLGFEFAYQYPGMSRVLQTAGRVIRGARDKGIICLVDRRFGETRYKTLFPQEWQVQQASSIDTLACSVSNFWLSHLPRSSDRLLTK